MMHIFVVNVLIARKNSDSYSVRCLGRAFIAETKERAIELMEEDSRDEFSSFNIMDVSVVQIPHSVVMELAKQ